MTIPVTNVRTSHALKIRANGIDVGLINSWNPTQSRVLTPIFEVDISDSGNPEEYMPGNASNLSISISRYDAYILRMEEAFGVADLVMLTRQSEPFDLYEVWKTPSFVENSTIALASNIAPSTPFVGTERFVYRGCWFTSLGRTLRSDDTRIVNVNASLVFTKKLKITGLTNEQLNTFSIGANI